MYQILSLDVECETLGGESWKLDVKCVAEIDHTEISLHMSLRDIE